MSCTYQEIIEILNRADSATDSTQSTAEFVYEEFKKSHPQIYIGRPSRFLETARRIAAPIRNEKIKGSAKSSYLKRQWKPRIRNVTTKCQGNCYVTTYINIKIQTASYMYAILT